MIFELNETQRTELEASGQTTVETETGLILPVLTGPYTYHTCHCQEAHISHVDLDVLKKGKTFYQDVKLSNQWQRLGVVYG